MSDHGSHLIERHCDVAILGGSAAGLAAALQLGRQRRSVIVIDPGDQRDAPAATGREEVRRHGGEVLDGRAVDVSARPDGLFCVVLVGGGTVVARRVLEATSTVDVLHDDVADAAERSSNQVDWDQRYSGSQIWSGNPNGTLVNEIRATTPDRALDVGAGEGGDAVWLAEQGWTVTASDISQRALDRIAAVAAERGLTIECHHADANSRNAYPRDSFDLVSAQYASIPRTPDDRAIANILAAVAIGGTLLIVGHDLEPMRRPIDTASHSRLFDPDAYVRPDDFAEAIRSSVDWTIEINEKRPRPAGAASGHHVDDIVLRARRVGPRRTDLA